MVCCKTLVIVAMFVKITNTMKRRKNGKTFSRGWWWRFTLNLLHAHAPKNLIVNCSIGNIALSYIITVVAHASSSSRRVHAADSPFRLLYTTVGMLALLPLALGLLRVLYRRSPRVAERHQGAGHGQTGRLAGRSV